MFGSPNMQIDNVKLSDDQKYLDKVINFILNSEFSNKKINNIINNYKVKTSYELVRNISSKCVNNCDNIRHILAYYNSNSLEEMNYINYLIRNTYVSSHNDECVLSVSYVEDILEKLIKEGFV